jgi:hypothetical protein
MVEQEKIYSLNLDRRLNWKREARVGYYIPVQN